MDMWERVSLEEFQGWKGPQTSPNPTVRQMLESPAWRLPSRWPAPGSAPTSGPSDSEPTTAFPSVQLRLCGDLGRGPWRLAALEPVPAPALCQPGVLLCHRHSLQTALPQTEALCRQWHRQGPAPRLTRSRSWRRLTGGEAFCPGGWPPGRNTKFTLRRGIWVCRPPFPSLVLCFKSEMPSSPGGIPGCSKQTKALALMER